MQTVAMDALGRLRSGHRVPAGAAPWSMDTRDIVVIGPKINHVFTYLLTYLLDTA